MHSMHALKHCKVSQIWKVCSNAHRLIALPLSPNPYAWPPPNFYRERALCVANHNGQQLSICWLWGGRREEAGIREWLSNLRHHSCVFVWMHTALYGESACDSVSLGPCKGKETSWIGRTVLVLSGPLESSG